MGKPGAIGMGTELSAAVSLRPADRAAGRPVQSQVRWTRAGPCQAGRGQPMSTGFERAGLQSHRPTEAT